MKKTAPPIFLFIFLLLAACAPERIDDDDSSSIPTFDNGFFIVNKGIAQNVVDGSISYYGFDSKQVFNHIFSEKNETHLEGTLTGLRLYEEKAYIIESEKGQITFADKNTMERIGIISNLQQAQHLLPINSEKAYISQWGNDGATGSIQILHFNTHSIAGEISNLAGPDRMLLHGNYVYATQTGGIFLDSTILKIDTESDQIVQSIKVGLRPQSMQVDVEGNLWVLSMGMENFVETKHGSLVKVVNDEVVFSLELPLGSRDLCISVDKQNLFFINGQNQKIYKLHIHGTSLPLVPFSEKVVTSLSYHTQRNLLIGLDAKNFQTEGKLLLFENDGSVKQELRVDYVPTYIAF